jgi:hypothetical protein
MLNVAIEKKPEFFQKTNASSSFAPSLPEKLSVAYSRVSTAAKSADFGCPAYSVFPVSVAPRPPYEWVVPSSDTSAFSSQADMIKVLLAVSNAAVETSRETADSAVQSVLVSVYELDQNGFGRLAAQEVMLFVEKNLRRNGMTEANKLLELADVSRLSSRSLIGLIRSTARLKDQLPAWKIAYLNSREQMAKQGKNPDALFVGLPKL